MDGLNVDQVVDVLDTPDRLTSQNTNGIDCTSDVSDGGWRNKNKQATRTNSRRIFISPCSGFNKTELHGNIQKISSRTTPPSKSALYLKGNVVDNTPNRLASLNINVIDCASDISDDGWKSKNKRATRTKSRRMFIPPCSGPKNSECEGNIRKIALRSTPPSESAFYLKKNAVDDTFNQGGKNSIPFKYIEKRRANSNISQNYVAESSRGEQHRTEMVDQSFSPLLIADDTDIGEMYEKPRTQKFGSQLDDSGLSRELTVKEKDTCRLKGKGILTDNILSEEFDEERKPLSGRTLAGKLDGVGPGNKEACKRSEEPSGWISTRKRTRKSHPYLSDEEHLCHKEDDPLNVTKLPRNVVVRKDSEDGCNVRSHSVSSQNLLVAPISLTLSQRLRGCLLDEKPRTSHRTQKFDSQQDDSGTSRELMVKEKDSRRLKGKGILIDNILSEKFDEKRKPLSGRTLAGRLDGVGPANKEACGGSEESNGWISTRKRTRKSNPSLPDEEHLCHKEDDLRNMTKLPRNVVVRKDNEDARNHLVSSQNLSVAPVSLTLSQKHRGSLLNEHHGSSTNAIKRRKKSSGTHHCGSSSSPIDNSEVLGFGSSGEPTNASRTQNSRTTSSFSQIIDIDDFYPERSNGSHNRDCSRNSESDFGVIQVEEDEILALELQEQLYYESNVAADREIDEQIALELQQGSFQYDFPTQNNHESHHRMHVLEASESVNNIGVASSLLQFRRDFNENDYEMLLALDENNHQHCGASQAQINCLPESTVQTDNLEACSVCLETPSIGDTMRHLPCLHRFHKNCVDEWLRRRASCPICKSFI